MFEMRYPYTPGRWNPDKVTNQEEVDAAIAEGRRWEFVAEFDYERPGPDFFNERARDGHSWFGILFNERAGRHINQFVSFIEARQSGTLDELNTVDRIEHDQMFAGNTMLQEAHFDGILTWLDQQEQGRVRTTGFLGSPTPAMLERQAVLDTLENETFARIIMGDLPLEAFDSFVTQWQNQGGDAITTEVNEWYESVR
jgi:putative aldouronate transport system substrate-binding protein